MTKRTKTYWIGWKGLWSFASSFLLFFLYSGAQDLDQSLAYGNEQFSQGHSFEAVKTLERVYFFGSGRYKRESAYLLAQAYYMTGELETAHGYYDLSFSLLSDDSLRTECIYGKAKCRLKQGNYEEAIQTLMRIELQEDSLTDPRQEFYLGAVEFARGGFQEAEVHFVNAAPEEEIRVEIHRIFKQNAKLRRIHPKLAKGMSMVLPGSGQFYAGDIRNGLNSLLLTAVLAGATTYMGIRYGILDAAITLFPWFFRYYRGGFLRAENIAWNKIQRKRALLYAELISLFSTEGG